MAEDAEEPRVGYKNPPLETRFQKGKSGNPSGKRKKVPPVTTDEAIDAVLSKPVYVTKNGKRIKMSRHMAVLEKLVATALAGDMRAMTLVLAQLNKKEKVLAHDTAEDLSEADDAILERLVARRVRAAASEGGGDE